MRVSLREAKAGSILVYSAGKPGTLNVKLDERSDLTCTPGGV